MISVLFSQSKKKLIGFKVSGHAGYAEAGEDVVCAAVSSAVQLICNLITENFNIPVKIDIEEDNTIVLDGSDLKSEQQETVSILLDGFKTHLEFIGEEYLEYISINYSEV